MGVARLWTLVALGGAVCACAAGDVERPEIVQALNRLYNFDFPSSHSLLRESAANHPNDPLPHALDASVFLMGELDRLGILAAEFFQDDRRLKDKRKVSPDPRIRDGILAAAERSERLAHAALAAHPNDVNALFALCLASGIRMDYTALIEKKLFKSYGYAKRAHEYASRVLRIDPDFYDVYLTVGFSEYLVGSLPFFVRWLGRMEFEGIQGSKEAGRQRLVLAAERGRYMGPFAQILLSLFYLREKRLGESREVLRDFLKEHPENPLVRRELARLEERIQTQSPSP